MFLFVSEPLDHNGSDTMPIEVSTLPHPPKTTLKLSQGENTHYTITKSIQIDAYTQQCDFDYDIVKTTKTPSKQDIYRSHINTESTSKGVKDENSRKKYPFPQNLHWGEFCCEKKCVKNTPMENQSPNKYNEKKDRPTQKANNMEQEASKTMSVDCRGKIKPQVFDFNEKRIHLPDLNSSHLKVNTYLTKLAKNRNNKGLVADGVMQSLNQNDIIGDNFRRHSDHIPRVEKGQIKVKACSSEKHISDKNVLSCPPSASPDHKAHTEIKGNDKATNTESPKKPVKTKLKNIPTLSIKICDGSQDQAIKSPEDVIVKTKRGLETDSSNECESETGIPKSPTLYISGVSICRETSPKSSLSTTALTNSDSNVSRSVSQSQYFSRTSSFRLPNSEQKSPKVKQKIAWKDYTDLANALPTSPVVHVTSPSLSPCSETMNTSTYTPGSPELYTPSLLRSTTPTGPRNDCHTVNHLSDESLSILDVTVLPPSHFSDDVFMDDDDPGLMIDCSNENIDAESSLHHPLRGTVYTGCHSGGIMISNMSSMGSSVKDINENGESKRSSEYICPSLKDEEALYENIFPKNSINDQLAFEMSLPNSPTGISVGKSNLQKSWSARPLITLNDFSDEALASSKLKSKSANEPERDREMFHFPKSSTDGALSSVLHVQESNLSSDDFHEALFLLERSPKTRDSKRRKRSKKKDKGDKESKKEREANADKKSEVKCDEVARRSVENLKQDKTEIDETVACSIENDSPSVEQDEVSSAL